MAFADHNTSSAHLFIEKTEQWVHNGMSVDGIPFFHRLGDLSFFQWEQLTFDIATCIAICYIIIKIIGNSKEIEQIKFKCESQDELNGDELNGDELNGN